MFLTHWRPQKDGSPKQWTQCGPVAAGHSADRAHLGVNPHVSTAPWLPAITPLTYGWRSALPTMAEAIMNWVWAHIPASHTVTGTTQSWTNAAIKALYGVTMGYRWAASWSLFWSFLTTGHGCEVSIWYGPLHHTMHDGDPGWTGRHRVYVDHARDHTWTDAAGVKHSRIEVLVHDGLADHRAAGIPQGAQWWAASLLQTCMYQAMGNATVEFSFGPQVGG